MLITDPLAGTFAGLYIDGYSITVHCSPSDNRVDVDPLKMPLFDQYAGRKFRCQTCGQIGQGILGAPITNRSHSAYADQIEAERNERRWQVAGETNLKRSP